MIPSLPVPEPRVLVLAPPLPALVPKTTLKKPLAPGPPRPSHQSLPFTSRHANGLLAQAAPHDKYAHHHAALATSPPTAGKQGYLQKAPSWPLSSNLDARPFQKMGPPTAPQHRYPMTNHPTHPRHRHGIFLSRKPRFPRVAKSPTLTSFATSGCRKAKRIESV